MSALTDKIARLRADLAAATTGPWEYSYGTLSQAVSPFGNVLRENEPPTYGSVNGLDFKLTDAKAVVSAVNAAPMLLDVVEAAAKRPWWQNVAEVSWRSCRACGAHWQPDQGNPKHRTTQPHGRLCWLADLDAALDRAEAEAAR